MTTFLRFSCIEKVVLFLSAILYQSGPHKKAGPTTARWQGPGAADTMPALHNSESTGNCINIVAKAGPEDECINGARESE
jgi:hypothetical protein